MKTFLSIDIDFWNHLDDNFCPNHINHIRQIKSLKAYLEEVTVRAKEMNIPISAVMNHQQMLPKVNKSEARQVINIDTHSDFVDTGVQELNCGTWLAYVKWRHNGNYIWLHAGLVIHGESNGDYPIFRDNGSVSKYSDWGSYDHNKIKIPPSLDEVLKDCVEVCVCSSPAYSDDNLIPVFTDWRNNHAIDYTKGIAHENYGRNTIPTRIVPKHRGLNRYGT